MHKRSSKIGVKLFFRITLNQTMQKKCNKNAPLRKIPMGILATPAWFCVRFYQIAISPILHIIPGSGCRFYPTCSEYTLIAIQKHGALKGCLMGAFRILRCNPFCKGGIDFVPEKFTFRGLLRQNSIDERRKIDS